MIANLEATPGMAHVAEQVKTLVAREEDRAERKKAGTLPPNEPTRFHHMVMSGPPGTGKTTVARNLAGVLKDLGITKTSKVVETHASELGGQFRGDAQANMLKAIEKAKGGVLFIDEAHQLADEEYGQRALRTLIKPMADPDFDTVVIFAGYEKDLKRLEKVDEGFKSRVPTDLKFQRFDADQLIDYAGAELEERRGLTNTPKAEKSMDEAMALIASNPRHASMRDVNNMIGWADDARTMRNRGNKKIKVADRTKLTPADWAKAMDTYLDKHGS